MRTSEQVYTKKKLLADLSHRVQQVRANIKRKRTDIENKRTKIDNCKKRIDDLTLTLEEIESQKLNIAERTKHLEKLIEVYLSLLCILYIHKKIYDRFPY